jgi:hypothetical protein
LRDERLTFWLFGAATVAPTMTATTLVGAGPAIAGTVGCSWRWPFSAGRCGVPP